MVIAYGAIAAWLFVGQIHNASRSSTSPANDQSWSMQKSETFGGAVTRLDIALYSCFWNSKGTWQIPRGPSSIMEQSLFNWVNFVLIAIVVIAVLALVAWGIFALVKRAVRRGYAAANSEASTPDSP